MEITGLMVRANSEFSVGDMDGKKDCRDRRDGPNEIGSHKGSCKGENFKLIGRVRDGRDGIFSWRR